MFFSITPEMLERMHTLEQIDMQDRQDGTPQARRLRQITPDTGRFLALMAALAPAGSMLELGTSAGYSTLWLTLAAQLKGQVILAFEVDRLKIELARETFRVAAAEHLVNLKIMDAREGLRKIDPIGFCFMDLDKELYSDCYGLIVPRLVPGGLLIADNVTSHAKELTPFLNNALDDPRVDAMIVPIGKGELLCRRNST